ncbi:FAD-dependent oxidoreductase, partial [bacterium]|nr:FAD-dependent oxidoreductase [bacterium]
MPSYDFLVIGSGIAGLTYALKAADRGTVCVVTKKTETDSNTNYAQGGVASVFGADDSPAAHVADTLAAGAGLSHRDAVEAMVGEGPALVEELFALGVGFTRTDPAHYDLGKEGGHSARRIVHAKDYTGFEIERVLAAKVRRHPRVAILEHHVAVDLIVGGQAGERRCLGAYVLDLASGEMVAYAAGAVLLASGGIGQAYLHTTNPPIATGDGIAMAWRAGATVANMEFVQFHPTTLYQDHADASGRSFLISEAVRGEGAVLRTLDGRAFMADYHGSADLAPRD